MFSFKKFSILLFLAASLQAGEHDLVFLDSYQDESILNILPEVNNVIVTLPDKVDRIIDENKMDPNIEQAVVSLPKKKKVLWPKVLVCGAGVFSIVALIGVKFVRSLRSYNPHNDLSEKNGSPVVMTPVKTGKEEIYSLQEKIAQCAAAILALTDNNDQNVQAYLDKYQQYLEKRIFTYQKSGAITPDSYCFRFDPANQRIHMKKDAQPGQLLRLFSYYEKTKAGLACLSDEELCTYCRLKSFFEDRSDVKDIIYTKYVAKTENVDLGACTEYKIEQNTDLSTQLVYYQDLLTVLKYIEGKLVKWARGDNHSYQLMSSAPMGPVVSLNNNEISLSKFVSDVTVHVSNPAALETTEKEKESLRSFLDLLNNPSLREKLASIDSSPYLGNHWDFVAMKLRIVDGAALLDGPKYLFSMEDLLAAIWRVVCDLRLSAEIKKYQEYYNDKDKQVYEILYDDQLKDIFEKLPGTVDAIKSWIAAQQFIILTPNQMSEFTNEFERIFSQLRSKAWDIDEFVDSSDNHNLVEIASLIKKSFPGAWGQKLAQQMLFHKSEGIPFGIDNIIRAQTRDTIPKNVLMWAVLHFDRAVRLETTVNQCPDETIKALLLPMVAKYFVEAKCWYQRVKELNTCLDRLKSEVDITGSVFKDWNEIESLTFESIATRLGQRLGAVQAMSLSR